MPLEPYENFLTRLDAMPDEALLEASEPDEVTAEREYGYEDEDGDHDQATKGPASPGPFVHQADVGGVELHDRRPPHARASAESLSPKGAFGGRDGEA